MGWNSIRPLQGGPFSTVDRSLNVFSNNDWSRKKSGKNGIRKYISSVCSIVPVIYGGVSRVTEPPPPAIFWKNSQPPPPKAKTKLKILSRRRCGTKKILSFRKFSALRVSFWECSYDNKGKNLLLIDFLWFKID